MLYEDRVDAGQKLAVEVKKLALQKEKAVVLGIPRGGVLVGAEVSKALGVSLDIVVPKKIGAPHNREVAIGAVAQDGSTFLNEKLISSLRIKEEHLKLLIQKGIEEIERRMKIYRGSTEYPDLQNKTIIIVDDGAATGYTMLAAAEFAKKTLKCQRMIIAVPVSPPDVLHLFEQVADEVVCPYSPAEFYAVGQFYVDFSQTGDNEVTSLIKPISSGLS